MVRHSSIKSQILELLEAGPATLIDLSQALKRNYKTVQYHTSRLCDEGKVLKNAKREYYLNPFRNEEVPAVIESLQMQKQKETPPQDEGENGIGPEEVARLFIDMMEEIKRLKKELDEYKEFVHRMFGPAKEARNYFRKKEGE